jgi:hypothetical protein
VTGVGNADAGIYITGEGSPVDRRMNNARQEVTRTVDQEAKTYEALRDKGLSKERSAKIANAQATKQSARSK